MFSNKNNKLIKKQNAGEPLQNMPLNMPLQNMPENMRPDMPPPLNMSPPQNMDMFQTESFSENYPNLDYLYDNITSQENHNNIKHIFAHLQ